MQMGLENVAPNLASLMFRRARRWPDRALFRTYRENAWGDMPWRGFAQAAASAARALAAMGIGPGDRVMIVSESRPEVPVAEVALMALRAVPVPAYTTNTEADHAHVLTDCGAALAIVSTPAHAAKLGPMRVVVMDDPGPDHIPFDALLASADRAPDDIEALAEAIGPDQLACLIYTSGTGGKPKGVMLPHRSMLANCAAADQVLKPLKLRDEVYLSFLPLSHAFEHTIGLFYLASIGTTIAYARGLETLATDMQQIRPTIMLVVPRFLAVLRGRIMAGLARQPAWRRALLRCVLAPGLAGRLLMPIARKGIQARFGGRLRAMMAGGARLDADLGAFFTRLGIETMQGYGQTEAGPVISCTLPGGDLATVGPPFPGATLRIAEDGEILIRGDLVMDGYWRAPEATADVLRDGWLHTGDVGVVDPQGNLRITDRKKDIIVLSGGDKVAPARIEDLLMAEPAIAQAVVAGDDQAGLVALIVPTDGRDDAVATALTRVNATLSVTERIRRHAVVPGFTVENGLLTPTQKIRRRLVLAAHADTLARLYGAA